MCPVGVGAVARRDGASIVGLILLRRSSLYCILTVRASGAAPIHRGDPGYASKLDRDGDGIGASDPSTGPIARSPSRLNMVTVVSWESRCYG